MSSYNKCFISTDNDNYSMDSSGGYKNKRDKKIFLTTFKKLHYIMELMRLISKMIYLKKKMVDIQMMIYKKSLIFIK